MKKLLFLSYCMPPLKYPRSIQISRLIKNMTLKPDVIYAEEKHNLDFSILENFDKYINNRIQIFYNNNRYINYIKRKLLPILFMSPDHFIVWSYKLYKVSKKYIAKNNNDTVVTFGEPMSVHLAGLLLKMQNNELKWVAHFSDPWVDNELKIKGFISRKINIYLENIVFQKADKLIFTSMETISSVSKRYQGKVLKKIVYLPHSYDSQAYTKEKSNNSKFMIRYVGNFYSKRSPEPLFNAIEHIVGTDPKILSDVCFEIIGDIGKYIKLYSKYKNVREYIVVKGNVSYKESLKMMVDSDVLLVIDAPSYNSLFFPSKLVDYIGSRKPIFGITPNGTSKNIIESLGGATANPNDLSGIIKMIKNVLKNKDNLKSFQVNNEYLRYDARKITEKFEDILNDI